MFDVSGYKILSISGHSTLQNMAVSGVHVGNHTLLWMYHAGMLLDILDKNIHSGWREFEFWAL